MNFLNKFRRLHWKLTLSYTLVSGSLFGGVFLLGVVAFSLFSGGINSVQDAVHNSLLTVVPPVTTVFFEEASPDINSVEQWLDGILADDVLTIRGKNGVRVNFDHVLYAAVLDDAGELLAVEPDTAREVAEVETAVSPILANAYANLTQPEQLRQNDTINDVLFWAIPVHADTSEELQGVVFIKIDDPSDAAGSGVLLFRDVSLFILSILATAFSVAFISSFFAARGLSKRLGVLANSTESWAKGDFSTPIQDSSQDEIGQLARQLNRMAEQLQNLLHTRSDLAALEERNRLARELHDSVKQQVFATVMQLGAAKTLIDQEPEAAKSHLVEGESLARQVQLELTGLIHELRPVNLREKGFVEAVRDYVTNWSARTQIEASILATDNLSTSIVIEQELFRVLQEALANVARHSRAKTVAISIREVDNELLLTVQDDGQGFELDGTQQQGVGLFSMKERIEGVNGRLHIQSHPKEGTIITAKVPL